ncbi:hypothetical protein Save01_04518 [Streptomyces avermitilis]|nr:hypothetical protein SAV14893_024480 [Streptomyces avermitilis]GDY85739.1 hypothetical protein SAVCW2_49380 [Streptomyces avermitilis]
MYPLMSFLTLERGIRLREIGSMSNITDTGKYAVQVAEVPPEEVTPGIVRRPLPKTDNARGWLIDFAPGTEWPEVDVHASEERYYVLNGEVIEGEERHGPGSYVVFAPGSSHRPRSDIGATILGWTDLPGA